MFIYRNGQQPRTHMHLRVEWKGSTPCAHTEPTHTEENARSQVHHSQKSDVSPIERRRTE